MTRRAPDSAATASGARSGTAAAARDEPRAMRTRARMLEAIRESVEEHGVSSLSVAALTRRADVHRATFYEHWADLRDAVTDAFGDELDRLTTVDDAMLPAAAAPIEIADVYRETQVVVLTQIAERRRSYRAVFGWPEFEARLRRILEHRVQLAIDVFGQHGVEVPGAVDGTAAAYFAGGQSAALVSWAASDATDAEAATAAIVAQLPPWWPRR